MILIRSTIYKAVLASLKLNIRSLGLKVSLLFYLISSLIQPLEAQDASQVSFVLSENQIKIPFRLEQDFVIVRARLASGRTANLLFDTGSQYTVIFDRSVLGTQPVGTVREIQLLGSDMSRPLTAQITEPIIIDLQKEAKVLRNVIVVQNDSIDLKELLGLQIDGILGMDIFRNGIMHLDYSHRKIRIISQKEKDKAIRHHKEVESIFTYEKPHLYVTISHLDDTRDSVLLLMDSGSAIPFVLHGNTLEDYSIPMGAVSGILGVGLGGYIRGYKGKIQQIALSGLSLSDQLTHFQDVDPQQLQDFQSIRNGLIGNQILQYMDPIIDFREEKVYLDPNVKRLRNRSVDKSGLFVVASGKGFDHFVAAGVFPGSPASRAGVKTDDIILALNGRKSKRLSLAWINSLLSRKPNKTIRLRLSSEGVEKRIKFRLEDYL